jgi:hypothetical protein
VVEALGGAPVFLCGQDVAIAFLSVDGPKAELVDVVEQLSRLEVGRIGAAGGLIGFPVGSGLLADGRFGGFVRLCVQFPRPLVIGADAFDQAMGGAGGGKPLRPGREIVLPQLEGGTGDLLDAQGAITGGGEQLIDAPFDGARALAHVITLTAPLR